MSLVSTKTPIFDAIPSIEFFNGRLLSGEDMTTEQAWNAARRKLLGQAIGSGVAFGLAVRPSDKSEHAGKPIVSVEPGLALNAAGVTLSLTGQADISLVQIEELEPAPSAEFSGCQPTQYGTYVKADGVYLLAICPAAGTQGRATVSGLANQEARCNRKYRREGVQFRLHQIKLADAALRDRDKLRNRVAYQCFNPGAWQAFVADPFGTQDTEPQLLDGLLVPKLDDGEVPLATVFWTLAGGIEYVDMWSARRRLHARASVDRWSSCAADGRRAVAEAMVWQFQAEVEALRRDPAENLETIIASERFVSLPPVGIVPLADSRSPRGFHPDLFFDGMVHHPIVHIEGARVEALVRAALRYPPFDPTSGVAVWIYRVRENEQAVANGTATASTQPYLIFSSGHMPYMGDPHFDVNRWNFGNWA